MNEHFTFWQGVLLGGLLGIGASVLAANIVMYIRANLWWPKRKNISYSEHLINSIKKDRSKK